MKTIVVMLISSLLLCGCDGYMEEYTERRNKLKALAEETGGVLFEGGEYKYKIVYSDGRPAIYFE